MNRLFAHKTTSEVSVSCQNTEKNANAFENVKNFTSRIRRDYRAEKPARVDCFSDFLSKRRGSGVSERVVTDGAYKHGQRFWIGRCPWTTRRISIENARLEMLEKTRNLDPNFEPHRKSIPEPNAED